MVTADKKKEKKEEREYTLGPAFIYTELQSGPLHCTDDPEVIIFHNQCCEGWLVHGDHSLLEIPCLWFQSSFSSSFYIFHLVLLSLLLLCITGHDELKQIPFFTTKGEHPHFIVHLHLGYWFGTFFLPFVWHLAFNSCMAAGEGSPPLPSL